MSGHARTTNFIFIGNRKCFLLSTPHSVDIQLPFLSVGPLFSKIPLINLFIHSIESYILILVLIVFKLFFQKKV